MLKESLLIDLQTGSCLRSQSLGELAHRSHVPLLHLLHVMLHPLLLLRGVANSLGLLKLVMVGHPRANAWPRALLLLLHHLLSSQYVSEL